MALVSRKEPSGDMRRLKRRSPGSYGVMIGPVDDHKPPAKDKPVQTEAESRAADLPTRTQQPTSEGGPDVALTYCEVVGTKRPCRADFRKLSVPVAPADAEARAIARRDAAAATAAAAAAAATARARTAAAAAT